MINDSFFFFFFDRRQSDKLFRESIRLYTSSFFSIPGLPGESLIDRDVDPPAKLMNSSTKR